MPPQTKPIDKRLQELIKATQTFQKQSANVGRANTRDQAKAAKEAAAANKAALASAKKLTAEMKQQNNLLRQNARLVRQLQSGGGGGAMGGSGGGRGGRGGGFTNLAGALGMRRFLPAMIPAVLIGGIVGAVTSQIRSGIDTFGQTVKTQRDTAGMISARRVTGLTRAAQPLGFGPQETLQAVSGIGRAVGVNDPRQFPMGAVGAAMAAQLEGMADMQQSTNLMGGIRRAGVTGFDGGQAGNVMFQRILAGGVASGLEKTRVPEHIANVSKGMDMVGENIADVVDVGGINQTLAGLGRLGAGFQGKRGAGVMNAFQNTFTAAARGQGSPDVQALMLQDVGRFGGPGANRSYFQAIRQLEKGVSDPGNIRDAVQGIIRRYGAGELGALALSRETGISATKSEAIIRAAGKGGLFENSELNDLIKKSMPDTLSVNEQAVELAAGQAKVQLQQFEIGKQLLDVVIEIQVLIGDLVKNAVPLIRELLVFTEDILHNTKTGFEVIKEWLPDGPDMAESSKSRLDEVQKIMDTLPREKQAAAIQKVIGAQEERVERIGSLKDRAARLAAQGKTKEAAQLMAQTQGMREMLPGDQEALESMQGTLERVQRRNQRAANIRAQLAGEREAEVGRLAAQTAEQQKAAANDLQTAAAAAKKAFEPFMKLTGMVEQTGHKTNTNPHVAQSEGG